MKYTIVAQEEKRGRDTVTVECKNVKMFPKHGKGGEVVGFGKLGFLLLQVIIQHEKGEQIRLKLSTYNGVNHPRFIVQQADKEEHPTLTVGQGKNRRTIPDTLAPMVRKPGVKDEYELPGFTDHLNRLVGHEMCGTIMQLFANRFAELKA